MEILSLLAENLQFMAEPWFAITWYLVGILGVIWVIYDARTANSALNPPLKVCWPILIFFFSIIGILLYLVTSRPLDAGRVHGHVDKMRHFTEYSQPKWRKVVASAAHCVGGDGLGIMTAMVAARLWGFTFWQEFWFEYVIGYILGWFLFQTWAMRRHGQGWFAAIWKGGRAEFFSMITVMLGMGVVMYWVTPAVVGEQPLPDTYAFWTFGALGLLAGFILTYPMNYWLVSVGWKHGQGDEPMLKRMDEERERRTRPYRERRAPQSGEPHGARTA
jgi:hypothetical protein